MEIVTSAYSFDISTIVGIIRLYARDNDPLAPIHTDKEISLSCSILGYNIGNGNSPWMGIIPMSAVYLAAATCLDWQATDAAKLASIDKIGAISENTKVTYDALREEADRLRALAATLFEITIDDPTSGFPGLGNLYITPEDVVNAEFDCLYGGGGGCHGLNRW